MTRRYYPIHYLLLLVLVYYTGIRSGIPPRYTCDILSPAPALHGINKSDDKVRILVFRQKPSQNRHSALDTHFRQKIKSGYTGGKCRYDLNNLLISFTVATPRNEPVSYYKQVLGLGHIHSSYLRGPPSYAPGISA